MCALAEEQRTAHECSLGDDNHSPTLVGGTVNDSLNGLCLHRSTVFLNSVVGNDISLAQSGNIHFVHILKPWRHRRAIGPSLVLREKTVVFHCSEDKATSSVVLEVGH